MLTTIPKRQLYLARKGTLWTERASFMPHWQELSRFLLPRSSRFFATDRNKGDKRFNHIYDSTGTKALRILSAGLMAGMTSPARPWFRLATRDRALMEFGPVKLWLDDVTMLMRDIFSQSNTYRALHTMYEEVGCFGTLAGFIDSDFDDVIRHYPMTVGEYALACGDRQEVNTFCREFDMTVAQIVQRYVAPDPNSKSATLDWSNVSTQVKTLYENGKGLDAWIRVIHLIEPRIDRDVTKLDSKNMQFSSCIFEAASTEDKVLSESGYKRFPVLAARWHAIGGDVYGTTCPGMEALGDTKQLQHGQLRKAQGIDYMVKPPLQAPPGTKSYEIDTLPGGFSVTNMGGTGAGGIRTAFEVKLDLQYQLEDIKDVRERIRATFFADLFMMIAMNERNQPDTAREIAEKHEEKLLMLGPVLERLHNELLKQFIDVTFDKMIAADIVPPPPKEMNGQELNVEFVSMLAQAQRAIGTQAIDRYVASLGMVAQFKPDVLDKFDSDEWADAYADMLGVEPKLIIGNDKVAIIRDQRAKLKADQAKLAAAQSIADTAKSAAQAKAAAPEGLPLPDVISGFSGYSGPGQPVAV